MSEPAKKAAEPAKKAAEPAADGKKLRPSLDVVAALNPRISRDELTIWFDARATYEEAAENIGRNGAVNGHPKTGAPLVNPYLAVRDGAAKTLERFHKAHPAFLADLTSPKRS